MVNFKENNFNLTVLQFSCHVNIAVLYLVNPLLLSGNPGTHTGDLTRFSWLPPSYRRPKQKNGSLNLSLFYFPLSVNINDKTMNSRYVYVTIYTQLMLLEATEVDTAILVISTCFWVLSRGAGLLHPEHRRLATCQRHSSENTLTT